VGGKREVTNREKSQEQGKPPRPEGSQREHSNSKRWVSKKNTPVRGRRWCKNSQQANHGGEDVITQQGYGTPKPGEDQPHGVDGLNAGRQKKGSKQEIGGVNKHD